MKKSVVILLASALSLAAVLPASANYFVTAPVNNGPHTTTFGSSTGTPPPTINPNGGTMQSC